MNGLRTLGLFQELEFPVNELRWLVGDLQACCYRAEDGNEIGYNGGQDR